MTEQASPTTDDAKVESQDHEPKKTLPSSRSAVNVQLDLLRAWAVASGSQRAAKSTPEVAKIAGRDSSTVSSCNGFFASVGLLRKEGRSYIPADEVVEFNRTHQWQPDQAPKKLSPIFRDSWAWESLGGRLSFSELTDTEAVAILAEACSAGPKYKNQLESLLEYLVLCGLIVRQDNGKLGIGKSHNLQDVGTTSEPPLAAQPPPPPSPPVAPQINGNPPKSNVMSLTMSIEVSMDDVSKLGPQMVANFFSEWASLVNAKAAIEKMLQGDVAVSRDTPEVASEGSDRFYNMENSHK